MPEILTNHVSRHAQAELPHDFSAEKRTGRQRIGRGIMMLLSRMHHAGTHGRHVNASRQQHPLTLPEGRPALMALPGAEKQSILSQTEKELSVVPEASNIRPEIPAAAIEAVKAEMPYVGRHRRPENLEESDAMLARKAAYEATLPSEIRHGGAETHASTSTEAGGTFSFSGLDAEPASHNAAGISRNDLWALPERTPGEHYDPADDVANMSQRTADARGIVPHADIVLPPVQAPKPKNG